MTVCVGILCEAGKTILLSCDMRVSYGDPISVTNDAGGKLFAVVDQRLYATIAGDIATCHMIEGEFHQQMLKFGGQIPNLETVKIAIQKARFHTYETLCDEKLQREYTISLERLRTDKSLTPSLRRKAWKLVKETDIGAAFIIGGFDDQRGPVFLSFCHLENIQEHPTPGYEVIGSGSGLVHAWLDFRAQSVHMSAVRSYYHLREAMFFAKLDPSVSADSACLLVRSGGAAKLENQDDYILRLRNSFYLRQTEKLETAEENQNFANAFSIPEQ